jgi:hypothetical protein
METKKATQVNGCKTCKKGLSKQQYGIMFLGLYMFAASIYGTYVIIQNLINLF